MNYPQCFYKKIFWAIIIPSFLTGVGGAYGTFNSFDERLRDTELQVAENNVPSLKAHIDNRFDKIESQQFENYRMIQQQNVQTNLALCRITHGQEC